MIDYHDISRETGGPPFLFKVIFITAGVIVGLILFRILFSAFIVRGDSMEPTYPREERVIAFRFSSPERGDSVIMENPHDPEKVMVRRILAKEDDTVEIKNSEILVNGLRAKITWKTLKNDNRHFPRIFTGRDNMEPVRLKHNEYFVLSDNIDRGYDSRTFGIVRIEHILGTIFMSF